MFSNELICEILIYINNNLNSKITIEDIESKFYYNKFYIMKLFKKEIGYSIIDYINTVRIYNSLIDIKETNNTILNISIKNGFYSIEYFSETFKKIVGVNPATAKKWLRKKEIIDIKKINILNDAYINLYYTSLICSNYLSKRKPKENMVKVLSIFK